MKNFTGKKVAVGVLAAILAAGTAAGGVSQIPYNVLADSVIGSDAVNQKGSLAITKTDSTDEKNPLEGAKFTLYQLMSISPGTTPGSFATYSVTEAFKDTKLKDLTPDALNEYKAADIEALAGELQAEIAKSSIDGTESGKTGKDGTTKVDDLALGYYMVIETTTPNGAVAGKPFFISVPMTNPEGSEWDYDVTATPKNEKLSLEKVVGNDGKPSNTAKEGDTIPFKVTTSIPDYTDDYFVGDNAPTFIVKDTMDDGLTIQDAVKVTVDNVVVDPSTATYAVTVKENTGTTPDLKVEFSKAFLEKHRGDSVVVEYTAKVNENAVSGTTGNGNMAFLTYNNQPAEAGETDKLVNPTDPNPDDPENPTYPEGPNDETETYTFKITLIEKTDDGNEEEKDGKPDVIKEGIVYTLVDENGDPVKIDGKTVTITPNATNGEIQFPGLNGGTYYLKETETKDGYTLLTNPIEVEITPGVDEKGNPDGTLTLKIDGTSVDGGTPDDKDMNTNSYIDKDGDGSAVIIVNKNKGFTIPTTGGMGIVIFLTIGLAGIAGISVVLMRKKRVEE